MVGVWIAPVMAQVMMTLLVFWAMAAPPVGYSLQQGRRQPGKEDDQQQHQKHHHGKGQGATEDVVEGDRTVGAQGRFYDEDRYAEGRRQKPDLDREHGDDAEPDEIGVERGHDRQHQRQHDQHDRARIEDGAERDHDRDIERQEAIEAETRAGDEMRHWRRSGPTW